MRRLAAWIGGLAMLALFWHWLVGSAHPDDAALLRLLGTHATTLAPVAERLLAAADGARIEAVGATADAATLRAAGVRHAVAERADGGVLFEVTSVGLGVSGAASGLLYGGAAAVSSEIRTVADLAAGLAAAKREAGPREVAALFVRPATGRWSLYLDTR